MAAVLLHQPSARLAEKTRFFPSYKGTTPSTVFLNGGRPLHLACATKVPSGETRLRHSLRVVAAKRLEYDVVVVGAGIIGLTIARQFLLGSDLSVAVVDARVPCSGATGAGQGYIWMGNRTPESDLWELAMRSKLLWEELAESIKRHNGDPAQILGWKKTGSLLIGRTSRDLAVLQEKVKILNKAGLRAEYLSASDLALEEPALDITQEWGAAFLRDDCQLDAPQTVSFIEQGNRSFISGGRYSEFFNEPAVCLLRSTKSGDVEAVQTSKNVLYGKSAIIIAAGAWSGLLMQNLSGHEISLDIPVKPRKGHLLLLENLNNILLNHGLMEVGYINHQVASQSLISSISSTDGLSQNTSISFTATTDILGNLVLGSSRQFSGFNVEVDDIVIKNIWQRAGDFLPALREKVYSSLGKQIRIGLRPYMPDGKPIIGPIPSLSNVFLAAGHEGCGLCTALGTAEMVADIVLGNKTKVDRSPFSAIDRC